MPNPAKKTVKRLPIDSAAPEEVVVDLRMMTWSDVTAWHTIIQPIIDATYSHWTLGEDEYKVRADVGWDWSANYSLVLVHNLARLLPNNASGRAFAMSLVVLTDDDEEIPVGMLTAVPEFQCQIEGVSGRALSRGICQTHLASFIPDCLVWLPSRVLRPRCSIAPLSAEFPREVMERHCCTRIPEAGPSYKSFIEKNAA